MHIVVCVKQVPDTTEVKIDPKTNTIIRQGIPSIVNPFDKNGVEAALKLKEIHGGKVTVISMGPPQAMEALKECIAMGADEAILVSDRAFGGADTLATSYTLAQAIRKIGSFDMIITGKQAIDGDTAQVGPEIAEHLNIPQVTCVSNIEVSGDIAKVQREHETGYESLEVKLPVLITVVKSINEPRLASVKGTLKSVRQAILVWAADDLDIDQERIGLAGSPTQVKKIFTPQHRIQGEIIQSETAVNAAKKLVEKLVAAKII